MARRSSLTSPPRVWRLRRLLIVEGLRGGWQPEEEKEIALDWRSLAFVVAGLVANVALIVPLGFTAASTVLFTLVAYGFGSRKPLRDAPLGFALALVAYLGFAGARRQHRRGPRRRPVRGLAAMDTLSQLAGGFAVALTPKNLMWCLFGTTLGTAIGVLPGLGPALTIALLLPITFQVPPEAAFILFAGIYYGAMYGGSTTSILLNTPGETATIVTALEGNEMARSGRAGAALATAAIGSFVAGTIGTLGITFVAPIVVRFALASARPNTSR